MSIFAAPSAMVRLTRGSRRQVRIFQRFTRASSSWETTCRIEMDRLSTARRIARIQSSSSPSLTQRSALAPTHSHLVLICFDRQIAPHTTVLLNGGFWQEGCPRILTTAQLAQIQATAAPNRFLSVVDVSCDFGVRSLHLSSSHSSDTASLAGWTRVCYGSYDH